MKIASITPRELYGLKQQGRAIDLVDVRTAQEYNSVHAEGARLIPLDQLTPEAIRAGRAVPDHEPIYVICKSGGRSMAACQQLASAGLGNVVNVSGGTTAWEKAGLPVVRNPPSGSGGKWVRRIGLALVLALLVLGFTVHPYFALAAAAGWLGLIFLTGGCPLATCDTSGSAGGACRDK